jgi:hypothetical protein
MSAAKNTAGLPKRTARYSLCVGPGAVCGRTGIWVGASVRVVSVRTGRVWEYSSLVGAAGRIRWLWGAVAFLRIGDAVCSVADELL